MVGRGSPLPRDLKPRDAEAFAFEDIRYTKADWVATVTFNRPKVYNSYRTETLIELNAPRFIESIEITTARKPAGTYSVFGARGTAPGYDLIAGR